MSGHEQVTVYNPCTDEIIEVDSGIAEMLELLWSLGIETDNSCEDNGPHGTGGMVWIGFHSCSDLWQFLRRAVPKYDALYAAMAEWHFSLFPLDLTAVAEETETHPPMFHLTADVRFPHSDYSAILANLEEALTE